MAGRWAARAGPARPRRRGPRPAEVPYDAVDQRLGGGGAGGDADGPDSLEPGGVDVALVVDQVGGDAQIARHLDEAVRVRRVPRPDHEHEVDDRGQPLDGVLA